jgi:nucleotide-binding universal stress UspA family protein
VSLEVEVKIVVGYLDSPEGEAALAAAIAEAKERSGELIVVHSRLQSDDEPWVMDMELDGLDRLLAGAEIEHRVVDITMRGRAADHILGVARNQNADLIVVGIKERSSLGKALFGSTAQSVLLGAHCPVLAVKAARPGAE